MNYKQILTDLPKYATTTSLASALFIALVIVFGFLNVVDSVPLLHQLLNLAALYYMYKDRENLLPKAKALFAQGTTVVQALLPADADNDSQD